MTTQQLNSVMQIVSEDKALSEADYLRLAIHALKHNPKLELNFVSVEDSIKILERTLKTLD